MKSGKNLVNDEDLEYSFLSILSTKRPIRESSIPEKAVYSSKIVSQSQIKVILLGEGAVGKTTLRLKYMGEQSTKGLYISTLGADFSLKYMDFEKESVMLQIWDIAGQNRFRDVIKSYFAGANGALVVYDLTRMETFEQVKYWIDHLFSITGPIPFCIIGNKLDIAPTDQRFADILSEADETIKKLNVYIKEEYNFEIHHFLTSAYSGENVDEAFTLLTKEIMTNLFSNFK